MFGNAIVVHMGLRIFIGRTSLGEMTTYLAAFTSMDRMPGSQTKPRKEFHIDRLTKMDVSSHETLSIKVFKLSVNGLPSKHDWIGWRGPVQSTPLDMDYLLPGEERTAQKK